MLYDREVPFEIRNQTDPHDSAQEVWPDFYTPYDVFCLYFLSSPDRRWQVGTLEAIKVKILIMGEEQNPLTLRIELTSENDLFFHFNHNLDEHGFRQVPQILTSPTGHVLYPTDHPSMISSTLSVADGWVMGQIRSLLCT